MTYHSVVAKGKNTYRNKASNSSSTEQDQAFTSLYYAIVSEIHLLILMSLAILGAARLTWYETRFANAQSNLINKGQRSPI